MVNKYIVMLLNYYVFLHFNANIDPSVRFCIMNKARLQVNESNEYGYLILISKLVLNNEI